MARRMGKTTDDQYMGGGTGNWSRAPKKKEAVKKSAPKPMKKRNMETANKVKAGLSKSKSMSGGSQGGGRAAAKSEVKAPIGMGAKPKTAPLKQRVNRDKKMNQILGGIRRKAGRRQRLQVTYMRKSSKLR